MLLMQITAAHGPAEFELSASLNLRGLVREADEAGIVLSNWKAG